jgi:hypothetical protein
MIQKSSGLHPESQRLLWAMVYDRRTAPFDKKAYDQLEQRGLIKKIDTGHTTFQQWEVTPLGHAVLPTYAPFLRRNGMKCPPDN